MWSSHSGHHTVVITQWLPHSGRHTVVVTLCSGWLTVVILQWPWHSGRHTEVVTHWSHSGCDSYCDTVAQWRFTYILLVTLAEVRLKPMPLPLPLFNFFSKNWIARKLKSDKGKDRIRTCNLRSKCQSAIQYTMEPVVWRIIIFIFPYFRQRNRKFPHFSTQFFSKT